MRFTDRAVESIQARDARYIVWAIGHRGLGLRVSARGEKSFVYSYRFDGRPRLLTIGDARGMTVNQAVLARNAAENSVIQAKNLASNGETPPADLDPGVKKRKAQEARKAAETMADLWKAFEAKRRAGWRENTARENARMWRVCIEPSMGSTLVRDVRPRDIKVMLDKIAETGPVVANRVRTMLSAMFHHATDTFMVASSPVQLVRRVAKEESRDRAMVDEAELRGFLAALQEPGWPQVERRALLWVLATGCRPGEAAAMTYAQIDEAQRTWTIPAEIAKTGLAHVVPLSAFALDILAQCKAAGAVTGHPLAEAPGTKPMSRAGLSTTMRLQAPLLKRHGVAPIRPHDMRRTCRTWLSKIGVSKDLAERCIGHVEKDPIVRTYDRHQWLPEKREAFEKWGATLAAMSK